MPRLVTGTLAFVMLFAPALTAQQGAPDGEWPVWGGDRGSTRYAPLDQIDRENVGDLEVAWIWALRQFRHGAGNEK